MTEPLTGAIAPAQGRLPAIPETLPDPRPYVTYVARLKSKESRATMGPCLDRIAAMIGRPGALSVPWHALRYEHTSVIHALIMDTGWSPSHKNKHLSALRGVIRQCWKLGLISADERDRACDLESDTGKREIAGRNIHPDEVAVLLASCLADENEALGIRDAALITLLYRTGVRREEAATALIERYDPGERSLKVIGKRDKERTVYIPASAAPRFERWLAVVGARRGPAFRPVDRWGNIPARPMSTRSVDRAIGRRLGEAKIQPLSAHDFRRTFIGDFIDAGGDLVQAQQLAGHASATTTAAYDRRPGRALRTAVDRLEMPRLKGAAK